MYTTDALINKCQRSKNYSFKILFQYISYYLRSVQRVDPIYKVKVILAINEEILSRYTYLNYAL